MSQTEMPQPASTPAWDTSGDTSGDTSASQSATIIAEAQVADRYVSRARPSFLYLIYAMIALA